MNKLKENWSLLIPVGLIIVSCFALPFLPEQIPMQVMENGEVGMQIPAFGMILLIPAFQFVVIFYNWQRRNRVQTITALFAICLAQIILLGFLIL